MKVYNKLVRDKIPEIIERAGKRYDMHIASTDELLGLLEAKLEEEFAEYKEDRNLEELADLLEVVIGLAKVLGYSEDELVEKTKEKRLERGPFEKGIVLERVLE